MEQIKGQICDLRAAWRRVCCRLLGREKVRPPFPGSGAYWEERYAEGGNSGVGSYGFLAEFKAEILNAFVAAHGVRTVIEFGCGDGNQLRLARYPVYVGYDVSRTAITHCRKMFKSDDQKSFRLMGEYNGERADLTLSLADTRDGP